MKKGVALGLLALAAVGWSIPAEAHHSFAMFDGTKKIKLVGSVREFQWSNPHVWIEFGVPDPSGKLVNWSIEAPAINGLARVGWNSRSLTPGDKVTLEIHPLKSGGNGGALVTATFPDGRQLGETMIQKIHDQTGK